LTLDKLTASEFLTCKEFGKAKIYLVNQDRFPETNGCQLLLLDKQIADMKLELGQV
jgi:hypothetical protein